MRATIALVLTTVVFALAAGCGGDDDAAVPEQAPGIAAPTEPLTETTPGYEVDATAAEGVLTVEEDLREAFIAAGAEPRPDEAVRDDEVFLDGPAGESCNLGLYTYGAEDVEFLRAAYTDSSQGVVTNQAGDLGVVVTADPDEKPACLRTAGPVIDYLVVGQAGLQRDPNAP